MRPMNKQTVPTPDEIAAALDASESDIAAGLVISADEVDRMIQERIDRLEGRLAAASRRIATPRR